MIFIIQKKIRQRYHQDAISEKFRYHPYSKSIYLFTTAMMTRSVVSVPFPAGYILRVSDTI